MTTAGTNKIILESVWLKASVVGGLWASVEIIIGSFFHNLRLPFAGTILAANATVLMIAFYQMWPEKGLIWRAGLIAALMKSISPSAIILGPMTGIMTEALLIEFFIRVFGNNLVSLSVAGALSVSSALIHKVVSLLILYGFNIVNIYINIFHFLAKQARLETVDPWVLVSLVLGVYVVLGIFSAVTGLRIGRKSKAGRSLTTMMKNSKMTHGDFLTPGKNVRFNSSLFFIHILIIPAGFIFLNNASLFYSVIFVGAYSALCLLRYRNSLGRLKKPVFWFQLLILTVLAAFFWNGFNGGKSFFDGEGLKIGFEMCIRAIFVVIAFSSFGVELRNPVIRDFLFRKGFDKIYLALGLSFSALPAMIEAMPGPKIFMRHPVASFSEMMVHARGWLEVFEKQ